MPISDTFAANGEYASRGAILAAKEAGEVGAVKATPMAMDTENKPTTAVRKVQGAIAQDGVMLFAGGILSPGSLAMGKEIERDGGTFILTAGRTKFPGPIATQPPSAGVRRALARPSRRCARSST